MNKCLYVDVEPICPLASLCLNIAVGGDISFSVRDCYASRARRENRQTFPCNLVPLPCRLRAGTPADTLRIAAALLEPLLGGEGQVIVELGTGVLAVDEIAKAAADAALARVEAAAGLAKVGDGAELAVDGAAGVPARVELVAGLLGRVLVLEAGVDVADEVVVGVVADDELLDLAVLAQLAPEVLVKGVKVVGALLGREAVRVLGVVRRVLVHGRQEDGLRVRRLDVLARAPVAVPARADLVVEGAVDLVLLRAEDGGEEVGHCELLRGRNMKRLTVEFALWNRAQCREALVFFAFLSSIASLSCRVGKEYSNQSSNLVIVCRVKSRYIDVRSAKIYDRDFRV